MAWAFVFMILKATLLDCVCGINVGVCEYKYMPA